MRQECGLAKTQPWAESRPAASHGPLSAGDEAISTVQGTSGPPSELQSHRATTQLDVSAETSIRLKHNASQTEVPAPTPAAPCAPPVSPVDVSSKPLPTEFLPDSLSPAPDNQPLSCGFSL